MSAGLRIPYTAAAPRPLRRSRLGLRWGRHACSVASASQDSPAGLFSRHLGCRGCFRANVSRDLVRDPVPCGPTHGTPILRWGQPQHVPGRARAREWRGRGPAERRSVLADARHADGGPRRRASAVDFNPDEGVLGNRRSPGRHVGNPSTGGAPRNAASGRAQGHRIPAIRAAHHFGRHLDSWPRLLAPALCRGLRQQNGASWLSGDRPS
jgi:hypothetical protein